MAASSIVGVTLTVFCSKAAAQALLVSDTRPPMADAFSVMRTLRRICSLWPGANARLPSVRLSATSVGSWKGSALSCVLRLQVARPVKPVAALRLPLAALGGPSSSHEATCPLDLSMSKVQFRLSITRTLGAATAPVLVTLKV
ncbi:hypothetical protein D9M72_195380 [compost metagenome]